MLRIAKDYERLAERAEQRAKGSSDRDRPGSADSGRAKVA
jgi:hypothetical protein